jgi:predicted MFS family arabinose efflux permease
MVELAAFRETSYTLFAIGIFLVFWGVYFAFYYVSSFGVDIIGIPQNESFNLFLVLNGVGIIGRTLPAYLADRYTGPMNILLMVTIASIICAWAMIGVTSREGLYAWTVVYGIVGNGLQAMFPATLSSLTTDLKKTGVRMGMIFVSAPTRQAVKCYVSIKADFGIDDREFLCVDRSTYSLVFDHERQWPLCICAGLRGSVYGRRVLTTLWG